MIDTVCLLIPKNMVKFTTKWDLHSQTASYEKYVCNANHRHKANWDYFPRLSGYKRKGFYTEDAVRIEFSVPKLLYKNNLQELRESDFENVVDTLAVRLTTMGVIIEKEVLRRSSVSTVHFAKNIALSNGYTSRMLIGEMQKVNISKQLDISRAKFTNNGEILHLHTNSYEFVVYDKIADLQKGERRSIDKDQTPYQMSLFEKIQSGESPLEVIRFEVRLNKKVKFNQILTLLWYEKNPRFCDIFCEKMSIEVVNHFWTQHIKSKSLGIFDISSKPKEILRTLLLSSAGSKAKHIIYEYGLFALARDEGGIRELRSLLEKRSASRTWYRIARDIEAVNKKISEGIYHNWITLINDNMLKYKPFEYKPTKPKKVNRSKAK